MSFRAHALTAEPFLLVGLVAVIRRILVVTAEVGNLDALTDSIFRTSMVELGVLTAMVVVLVSALRMLRSGRPGVLATRA